MAPSPVVARWELSRRLATRRKELGVSVEAIAKALGFSRNYWSAVENDRTLIAEEKLRLLFGLLEFEEQDQQELLRLREDARAKGWWDEFPALSTEEKRFCGMEGGARRIREYGGHIVPGLLQIEEYARALIEPDPYFSELDTDRVLNVRQRRQMRLRDQPPVEVLALLSEAALRQQVAGPRVQARQLRHLLRLASASDVSVEIRVIPFDTNPGAIAGSSTLLFFEFESPSLPMIAFQEAVRPLDSVAEGDEQFRRLELAWQDGYRRSLHPSDSMALVRETAEGLELRSAG